MSWNAWLAENVACLQREATPINVCQKPSHTRKGFVVDSYCILGRKPHSLVKTCLATMTSHYTYNWLYKLMHHRLKKGNKAGRQAILCLKTSPGNWVQKGWARLADAAKLLSGQQWPIPACGVILRFCQKKDDVVVFVKIIIIGPCRSDTRGTSQGWFVCEFVLLGAYIYSKLAKWWGPKFPKFIGADYPPTRDHSDSRSCWILSLSLILETDTFQTFSTINPCHWAEPDVMCVLFPMWPP